MATCPWGGFCIFELEKVTMRPSFKLTQPSTFLESYKMKNIAITVGIVLATLALVHMVAPNSIKSQLGVA